MFQSHDSRDHKRIDLEKPLTLGLRTYWLLRGLAIDARRQISHWEHWFVARQLLVRATLFTDTHQLIPTHAALWSGGICGVRKGSRGASPHHCSRRGFLPIVAQ